MTLIAFAAHEDRAEILTDSLSYDPCMLFTPNTSKVVTLPHIDAAMLGQGSAAMTGTWAGVLKAQPELAQDFDVLADAAEEQLRGLWSIMPQEHDLGAWIYHVGWSGSRRRFVAYSFSSDRDFAREDLTDHAVFSKPAVEGVGPPKDDLGWITFGYAAYHQSSLRPLQSGEKWYIGGPLMLTRIEPGTVTQRRLDTIPQDERWREMLIGTLHPVGQRGPCPCGSGQPFLVCHLPWRPAVDCTCDSGKPFSQCHQVPVNDLATFEHWRTYPGDFHRTQDKLARAWVKAFPDEPTDLPPPPTIIPPRPAEDS